MPKVKVVHKGDAGTAGLFCSAKPVGRVPAEIGSNWTWVHEKVTCKRCLAAVKRGRAEGSW